ncbi:MAG: hypothetical protein Q9164_003931 [Protoblastenia rupestris]
MAATNTSSISVTPIQILTPAAPTTINKPVPIAPTPGSNLSPTVFTNKEWVIPPRPKPGRKPAGDAPPTKRKAQNREAQRAFRERRAAKVGELEEQLKDSEEESRRERDELRGRVEQLQADLQHYTDLVSLWQQKFRELEVASHRERQLRQIAEDEFSRLKRGMQGGSEVVALPERRETNDEAWAEQQDGGQQQAEPVRQENMTVDDGITCGRCNGSSRCQCIEEAFEMGEIAMEGGSDSQSKRSHSPLSTMKNKRICRESAPNVNDGNEIDFTAKYASQRPQNNATSLLNTDSKTPGASFEPCEFCKDGDVCICAALAAEIQQQPSLKERASSVNKTYATSADPSQSCTNNPGSCVQCQSNPTSTLFCKTLAASRNTSDIESDRIVPDASNVIEAPPLGAFERPTLTCADAFTTLSRHRAFPQASTELATWVSQLTAVPGNAKTEGKTAFEIEAASVMSVLQFFDTRFGDRVRDEGLTDSIRIGVEEEC